MRKYIAAAFSIAIAIEPAAALDLGAGVQAGGVGIGTSVGVGRNGASVGIGTSLGGLGGVDTGASVGTSSGSLGATIGASGQLGGVGVDAGASVGTTSGSLGASIGASGRLGGASSGLSAGTEGRTSTVSGEPGAASGRSAAASRSKGRSTAATTASLAPAEGVRQSIALPKILWPSGRSDRSPAATAIGEVPGTPRAVVRACREAVESAAVPFGVVSIRARSAGSLRRLNRGAVSAPIQVRIHYARQGGAEIRQARIRCKLDAAGKVIELT